MAKDEGDGLRDYEDRLGAGSTKAPDAVADMGRHYFRYALYPHANGPQLGGVIPEAAAFNQPLTVTATAAGTVPPLASTPSRTGCATSTG